MNGVTCLNAKSNRTDAIGINTCITQNLETKCIDNIFQLCVRVFDHALDYKRTKTHIEVSAFTV